MSERGISSVFEGSDGTGKSLQVNLQAQHLIRLGYDPLLVFNDETGKIEPIQEPGGTPFANALRRKIKDRSISRTPWQNVVWFTDCRKSNWFDLMLPALEAGRPVPTARSFISTVAYQGYGEGVPIDEILDYTKQEVGEEYMQPDFLAILALKNEMVRKQRLASADRSLSSDKDTFESMPEEFQQNMQNGYVQYALDNNIEITEADGTPEELEARLWAQIKPLYLERP